MTSCSLRRNYDSWQYNTILLLHELIIAFFSQFSSPPHIINGDVVSRVDSKQAAASYIIKKDITFSFSKSPCFFSSLSFQYILSMRDSDNPSMAMKTKNVNLTLFITCILRVAVADLLEKTVLLLLQMQHLKAWCWGEGISKSTRKWNFSLFFANDVAFSLKDSKESM